MYIEFIKQEENKGLTVVSWCILPSGSISHLGWFTEHIKHARIQEGGQGVRTPPPPPP